MRVTVAQFRESFDPAYLNLFILPTEHCNFRCTYCYEDFKLGRMSPEVVRGVKRLLSKRLPSLHTLDVSWFGGEPLLAMPVIEEVSEHILGLTGSSSHPVTYRATITTNGYRLDLPTIRRLVTLGVTESQVSLDGLAQTHDRTRRRSDGVGTFERIWSNLVSLRDSDVPFKILLRVHFSPDNYSEIDELVSTLNSEFSGDPRFTVFFKSIARLGSANDKSLVIFTGAAAGVAKRSLQSRLDSGFAVFEDAPVEAGTAAGICYAAKPNSLVIRSNGTVGKCTVALSDDRNVVGRLTEDGNLDIDQRKLRVWLAGFQTLEKKSLECPFSTMIS
jgi:uncharacterized protein